MTISGKANSRCPWIFFFSLTTPIFIEHLLCGQNKAHLKIKRIILINQELRAYLFLTTSRFVLNEIIGNCRQSPLRLSIMAQGISETGSQAVPWASSAPHLRVYTLHLLPAGNRNQAWLASTIPIYLRLWNALGKRRLAVTDAASISFDRDLQTRWAQTLNHDCIQPRRRLFWYPWNRSNDNSSETCAPRLVIIKELHRTHRHNRDKRFGLEEVVIDSSLWTSSVIPPQQCAPAYVSLSPLPGTPFSRASLDYQGCQGLFQRGKTVHLLLRLTSSVFISLFFHLAFRLCCTLRHSPTEAPCLP